MRGVPTVITFHLVRPIATEPDRAPAEGDATGGHVCFLIGGGNRRWFAVSQMVLPESSDADVRVDFIGCVEAGPKSSRLPQELRRSAPTFFFFQISHS
jgi:hypothetical protein